MLRTEQHLLIIGLVCVDVYHKTIIFFLQPFKRFVILNHFTYLMGQLFFQTILLSSILSYEINLRYHFIYSPYGTQCQP